MAKNAETNESRWARWPNGRGDRGAARAPYAGAFLGLAACLLFSGHSVGPLIYRLRPGAWGAIGAFLLALAFVSSPWVTRTAKGFWRSLLIPAPAGNAARFVLAFLAAPAAWGAPLPPAWHPHLLAVAFAVAAPPALAWLTAIPGQPASGADDDWIGRDAVVGELARVVTETSARVVALTGPLGSGKSWVLGRLASELEGDLQKPIVVRFNAWLPSGEEAMAVALADSVAAEVRKRYWIPFAAPRGRAQVAAILRSVPRIGISLSRICSPSSQSEATDRLARYLGALPVRVIVLLDELDRADRAEVREAMKILRGLPEIPNLRFVCALDPVVVGRALCAPEETAERCAEYVEKFFTVRFRLPGALPEVLRARCRGQITGAFAGYAPAPGTPIEEELSNKWDLYRRVFTTPRRVEMVTDSLASLVKACGSRPNLKGLSAPDLLNLACLIATDPGTLTAVEAAPEYFANQQWAQTFHDALSFVARGDAWRTDAWKYFTNGLGRRKEAVGAALVGALFPEVECWRESGSDAPGAQAAYPSPQAAEAGKRIYHPRFLTRYLSLAVRDSEFPEHKLEELWAKLATSTEEQARNTVSTALEEAGPGSLKSGDLLDQLLDKLTEAPLPPAPALWGVGLAALAEAPKLGQGGDASGLRLAVSVILRVAAALGTDARQFLIDAIAASSVDELAGFVVFAAKSRSNGPQIENIATFERELLAALADRYAARFAAGQSALLDQERQTALTIISYWRACGREAVAALGRTVTREFADRPKRIGRLLGWLAAQDAGGQISAYLTQFGLEPGDVIAMVDGLGRETVASRGQEHDAIERLRGELLSAEQNQGGAADQPRD